MRGVVWKIGAALLLVWGGVSFEAASAETFIGITGRRTVKVGDPVYYSVAIIGVPGKGEVSLRLGSPPGGFPQGEPQSVPEGVDNWTGLFPIQFGNITPYPIESTIHAAFTGAADSGTADSGAITSAPFPVTVLPLRWGVIVRKREADAR